MNNHRKSSKAKKMRCASRGVKEEQEGTYGQDNSRHPFKLKPLLSIQ